MLTKKLYFAITLSVNFCLFSVLAEGPTKLPEGVVVNDEEIILKGIKIDRKTLEVRIDAEVCLREGLLEYVVCGPDTFEHESIFTTKANPELLHLALALVRSKPLKQLPGLTALWYEKAAKAADSKISIEVEWTTKGGLKRIPLVDMIRTREFETEIQPKNRTIIDRWIFAGSFLTPDLKQDKNLYAANLTGIIVGIFPERSAVIQHGIDYGNPYEANKLGVEILTDKVPPLKTPVKLVFSVDSNS